MTATRRKITPQQQSPAVESPMVLLASISGRTPSVPENAAQPERIRLRPTDEQVKAASGMASEIADEKTYREDFGKRAPEPAAVSSALARAHALSDELARAEAWLAYLKGESASAWQRALELTGRFQEHFDIADRADPEIARRYPDTTTFYRARSKSAERAVATRRRNRAAKPKNP